MAAADVASKKRKVASETAPKAKKPRKSDDIAAPAPAKPAKSPKAAKAAPAPAAKKSARKTAEDFMSEDEAPAPAAKPTKATKGKKKAEPAPEANGDEDESMLDFDVIEAKKETPKKEAPAPKAKAAKAKKSKKEPVAEVEVVEEVVEVPVAKATKAKKGKKAQEEPVEEAVEIDAVVTEDGDVEDAVEDDQTAALLAGFSSDDSDTDNDIDFPEDSAVVPKLTKSQKKAIARAKDTPKATEPGVIYVGRVPRGFFEPQMKKYFSQFGRVLNLRLSRNKKTGASKHYAFVEFASAEVADIVARTMNNYLMFGHILRVALIPKEQVNANLFKGANTRFKVDPRNKKAGLAMERGAERPVWEKRVEKENKRRTARAKDLKDSMDYEFTTPGVKSVDTVKANKALEPAPNSAEQQLLTEAAADSSTKAKKSKKAAAAAAAKAAPAPVVEETVVAQTVVEDVPASSEAPAKRATRKRTSTTTTTEVVAEKPAAAEKPKAKKAKKAKA
ncbi:hypothetical protein B5807_03993 [Epicoccum nigrum]|uniref:RRM domain-containing protein n=1 Tax=Epicoccum nigrum TaxID=105696 RepID=A0A1Y2M6M6_EPING|nr:hypothetical protein B5807_03993 [Epicoccum nigrum]